MTWAWYVLQVFVGHERKVQAELLRRRQAESWSPWLADVVIPTESVYDTHHGQPHWVRRPLAPGYVLVHLQFSPKNESLICEVPSVLRFVAAPQFGSVRQRGGRSELRQVFPLSPAEVAQWLPEKVAEPPPAWPWRLGETVHITAGPFRGYTGTLVALPSPHPRARLAVRFRGQSTIVEVDPVHLAPLP